MSTQDQSLQRKRGPVPNPIPSFWIAEPRRLDNYRSVENLPIKADVVIIGSGFSGVSTAYHIFNNNPKPPSVVLLEARKVCSGATGRNGGHMKPDVYFTAAKHAKKYGSVAASEVTAFELANLYALKEMIELEKLDCDFHLTRAVDVYLEPEYAEQTEKAYRELAREGVVNVKDVEFTPKEQAERISGVKGAQCCFSFTAGHLWPSKMIHQLLERLLEKGLGLHANTPVSSVCAAEAGKWLVHTERGSIITSKVIHATNGYVSNLLPEYERSIVGGRGICSHITSPKGTATPHLPNTYCIRFNAAAYDYLIPRPDGSIIVGGAKQKFKHDLKDWYGNLRDNELMEQAVPYFDGYMQQHFRGWEDSGAQTNKVWTGVMGYSADGVPHVGEVPGKPGQYIMGGFSGHGMPVIFLTGKALADMIIDGASFEATGLPQLYKTTIRRNDIENPQLDSALTAMKLTNGTK